MTQIEAVKRWVDSSQEDWEVAQTLFENKRYAHSLFFCHLTIEKLLKAIIVKSLDDAPPVSHKLVYLAQKAQLSLDESMIKDLTEITTFNVDARYNVFKEKLYKKATMEFTMSFIQATERIRQWLISQL